MRFYGFAGVLLNPVDALNVSFYRSIFMVFPLNIPSAKHPQFCFSPLVWFALIFMQGFLERFMWRERKLHCVNTEMLATQSYMATAVLAVCVLVYAPAIY